MYRRTINVRDYGAKGDGSANDTTPIANAATAAIAAKGILWFPKGTYLTDTISITSASGLTIAGEGIGSSVIKQRTSGQVLHIYTSDHVQVRNLTFDGSCAVRTPGGQAVIIDASLSSFCDNETINSGEYANYFGGDSDITDVIISRNLIRNCYADGINLHRVTRAVVSDNLIASADDDCIALDTTATHILVANNYCRARTDLATTWGRGILVYGSSDVLIQGNYIVDAKQYGIIVTDSSTGVRPTRIQITGNTIKDCARESGDGVVLYRTTDCIFSDNTIIDPVSGNCLELADWDNLTIQGGYFGQSRDQFCRGIHADETGTTNAGSLAVGGNYTIQTVGDTNWVAIGAASNTLGVTFIATGAGSGTGVAAPWKLSWDTLKISRVSINMSGASTNSCIYLSPAASHTMDTGIIDGVVGQQVVAGDYIAIASARAGTLWKLVNNTTATSGRTVSPSTGGVFTTTNNN